MQRDEVDDWLGGRGPERLGRPEVGALLVAMPALAGSPFARSVVMLIGSYEGGFQGVILSEPMRDDVRSVLPQWWRSAVPPRRLHEGGPCAPDMVLCLAIGRHDLAHAVPGLGLVKRYRHQSLYWVESHVDPDVILPSVSGVRLFRGYSGWDPGQLEMEIGEGAWMVLPSEVDDAVSGSSATLWRQVLARQSGDAAFLRACPENPSRN